MLNGGNSGEDYWHNYHFDVGSSHVQQRRSGSWPGYRRRWGLTVNTFCVFQLAHMVERKGGGGMGGGGV